MQTDGTQETSYFASVAESYDRLQPVIAGRSYSNGLEMIVDLIPFDPEDSFGFVELGCGTAEPSMRVLQHFPHSTGICVDSEQEMLELARRKLATYGERARIQEADIVGLAVPPCDVVFSSKAFHHVAPAEMPSLLSRIAQALCPGGCFILYDHMTVGSEMGPKVREQSRRLYHRHVREAIAAGQVTQEEIDARWSFKKRMKAQGKDVEYCHNAHDLLTTMAQVGFVDAAIAWRMFADTILLAFTQGQDRKTAKPTGSG